MIIKLCKIKAPFYEHLSLCFKSEGIQFCNYPQMAIQDIFEQKKVSWIFYKRKDFLFTYAITGYFKKLFCTALYFIISMNKAFYMDAS